MDEFYGTAAGFQAYHTARGRIVDSADIVTTAALLIASEWLDAALSHIECGRKVGGASQWRSWPRTGIFDRDGYVVPHGEIPQAIERATYELALRELRSPGALTKDHTPSQYKRVRVEGAVDVEYANVGAGDLQTQFPIVWQILHPLIGGYCGATYGLSGKVVRA